jgi:hypothetical protein
MPNAEAKEPGSGRRDVDSTVTERRKRPCVGPTLVAERAVAGAAVWEEAARAVVADALLAVAWEEEEEGAKQKAQEAASLTKLATIQEAALAVDLVAALVHALLGLVHVLGMALVLQTALVLVFEATLLLATVLTATPALVHVLEVVLVPQFPSVL